MYNFLFISCIDLEDDDDENEEEEEDDLEDFGMLLDRSGRDEIEDIKLIHSKNMDLNPIC